MNEQDQKFMEECEASQKYDDVNAYKQDVERWLTLSDWHYSKESAHELVERGSAVIQEAFEASEPVSDIALDIGFCCG